mgnify:CR=1 FL=1
MGFGKSFLLSLVAFVGLNFIFIILYFILGPGIGILLSSIETAPLLIIYYLFCSIIFFPSNSLTGIPVVDGVDVSGVNWIMVEPFITVDIAYIVLGIGYLIAPIIAAILAGRFGESKGQSFGGWALTSAISTAAVIIVAISGFSSTFQGIMEDSLSSTFQLTQPLMFEQILIFGLISSLINIIFYGFFALLMSKIEYY